MLRCSDHDVRANQTYHQDDDPDRTFHGLFSLRAGPLGAETLTATHYTVQSIRVQKTFCYRRK